MFMCGLQTCHVRLEYCYVVTGGPPPPPDSGSVHGMCMPYPKDCAAMPSCGCIEAATTECITSCMETSGEITVQCNAP